MKQLLSKIPSINKILMTDKVKELLEEYPEIFVKDIVKKEVDNIKNDILQEKLKEVPAMDEIVQKLCLEVKNKDKLSLRRIVNATGTILHTNLGRSLLSERVKENLTEIAFNY